MNCAHCGKKIDKIESLHGFLQDVHDCNCGSITIEIPEEHYSSLEDIKCPYCGKFPFPEKKIHVMKNVIVSIIEEEDIDKLL